VLDTRISTVAGGRLIYRGHDAVALAEHATMEEVAQLLWAAGPIEVPAGHAAGTSEPFAAALSVMVARTPGDPPTLGRPPAALRTDALSILGTLAAALAGPGDGALDQRLATRWHRPEASDVIRRALVLLADHELNASTFAARVAVSTGASLAAGALAALATLTGPLHGRAASAVAVLVDDLAPAGDILATLRDWVGEGRFVPGFGHRLYRDGDIRAAALLDRFRLPPAYEAFREAAEDLTGEAPNTDFALAALCSAYDLPPTAPLQIFALARSVGWLAHMLEQAETGALIRPRARYIGLEPTVT
jgi:citrate synthase